MLSEESPANSGQRWKVKTFPGVELEKIDRAYCGGSIEARRTEFERLRLSRQKALLKRLLKSRPQRTKEDRGSYIYECGDLRFRFWVYEAERHVLILPIASTLTEHRH